MRKRVIDSLLCSGVVVAFLGIAQIGQYDRVRALYDVPNSLALFLVPLTVIATWVGYREDRLAYRWSGALMFIAILATQSAAAIIALGGALLISVIPDLATIRQVLSRHPRVFFNKKKRGFWYVGVFACIVVIVFFVSSGRLTYLLSPLIRPGTTNSVTVRLQLWDIGARLIRMHPLLGIGLGQFEPAYQAELHRLFSQQENGLQPTPHPLQPEFVVRDPHNWIISYWLNLGVLGLASFVVLNSIVIKKLRNTQLEKDVYAQAAILAIISLLIFGLFDTVYWKNDLAALWWMLCVLSVLF